MRPPTFGPCSASPTHRSLRCAASNRPNTAGPPSAAGPISSRRWNSRSSVDSDGAQPAEARRIRGTCAAVRSGFSRFNAAASSSTVRVDPRAGLPRRRRQRVEPARAVTADPPIQGVAGIASAARRTGRRGCARRSPAPPGRGPWSTGQAPAQGRSTGSGTTPPAAPAPAGSTVVVIMRGHTWIPRFGAGKPGTTGVGGRAVTLARIPTNRRARQRRLVLPTPATTGQPGARSRPAEHAASDLPRRHRAEHPDRPEPAGQRRGRRAQTRRADPATDSRSAVGTRDVDTGPAGHLQQMHPGRVQPRRPSPAASPAPSPPAPATPPRSGGDPAPAARAISAAPITSAAYARRSNTVTGNNTCVTRHARSAPAAAAAPVDAVHPTWPRPPPRPQHTRATRARRPDRPPTATRPEPGPPLPSPTVPPCISTALPRRSSTT